MLLTFEGGEGSGKTTVIKRVQALLESEGKKVLVTREPGGVPLGELIRKMVLESPAQPISELFLFLASRAEHVATKILPALHSGTIVLCDRFSDSTLAYQGYARGLGIDRLLPMCQLAAASLEPHITFFLDIAPEIGLERARRSHKQESSDRMESEKMTFHQKVREGFLELARRYPSRIRVIDASAPLDEVVKQVMGHVHTSH